MIINHVDKFVFIHIQKTAGTSTVSTLWEHGNCEFIGNPHSLISDVDLPKDYFKFTFVRNPYDRLVSWYNMVLNKGKINDFFTYVLSNSNNFSEFLDLTDVIIDSRKELVNNIPNRKSISFNQLDYITDKNGNIGVDFIGRFENLDEDFKSICDHLGYRYSKLSKLNSYKHEDYRTYYTTKDIDKVAKMYSRDIEYFKYDF